MPHPAGKRNDEENAKEKLFTYATFVPTASFKVSLVSPFTRQVDFDMLAWQGLGTVTVDAE
jgi:large subunit ribosomal protein L31e